MLLLGNEGPLQVKNYHGVFYTPTPRFKPFRPIACSNPVTKQLIFNSPSWVFHTLQMVAIEPIKWPSLSSDVLASYCHDGLSSILYVSASFHVGLQDYVYFVPHESS